MISVVVPAYNEEEYIAKTLESLASQDTKDKYEVILVDNNSTDKTVRIVNGFRNKLELKVVREKIKGRGAARAAGFNKTGGEIILSTDADTTVPINWISKMTAELRSDKNNGAVTGTCKFCDQSWSVNIMLNIFQPLAMILYRIIFGHYWLSGFNFGIYKAVYEKSGGFLSKLNIQEDIELSFKVAKLTKIKFVPDIPVIASGRRFSQGLWRGMTGYVSTFIGYFWQHNDQALLLLHLHEIELVHILSMEII